MARRAERAPCDRARAEVGCSCRWMCYGVEAMSESRERSVGGGAMSVKELRVRGVASRGARRKGWPRRDLDGGERCETRRWV